jgi:hypothetical protein
VGSLPAGAAELRAVAVSGRGRCPSGVPAGAKGCPSGAAGVWGAIFGAGRRAHPTPGIGKPWAQ